jgi:hypothetical protein
MSEVQPLTEGDAELFLRWMPTEPAVNYDSDEPLNNLWWQLNDRMQAIAEGRHRVYDASTSVALLREDVEWILRCTEGVYSHDFSCPSRESILRTVCTCRLTERLERVRGMMK